MEKKKENILVCSQCGSRNVQVLVWVDANTNEHISDGPNDRESFWCSDCEEHHYLCTEAEFTEKMNRWFNSTEFKTLEIIFGLRHEDFNEEDGYQEFVDKCHSLWEKLHYEDKRKIFNENKTN